MDKEELKQIYASIHTLRLEGDGYHRPRFRRSRISIHTLRMKGDFNALNAALDVEISIHTLRMEGDSIFLCGHPNERIFQSTPSAWRVTIRRLVRSGLKDVFQSTPSAWRVTR